MSRDFLAKSLGRFLAVARKATQPHFKVSPTMTTTFKNIRDALARYASSTRNVPDTTLIYDWKSLRNVVNRYGKTPLLATEEEAGFTFVNYKPEPTRDGYTLVVDLREPQEAAPSAIGDRGYHLLVSLTAIQPRAAEGLTPWAGSRLPARFGRAGRALQGLTPGAGSAFSACRFTAACCPMASRFTLSAQVGQIEAGLDLAQYRKAYTSSVYLPYISPLC